jgi:quinol monooxygenase YgiN
MIANTSILRAKPGYDRAIREALLDLAESVQEEVATLEFRVVQDRNEPTVFTLISRFADQTALDAHNNSDEMNRFLWAAKQMLDGPITLSIGEEIFVKSPT